MNKKAIPIPLTQEKFEALKAKKISLQTQIKETQTRLIIAREQGDLSENGAYKYAKIELGSLRRQLREVVHTLEVGVITERQGGDHIGFGSVVTLQLLPEGKEVVYTLLSDQESDIFAGKLSLTSPLGKMLDGKRAGDEVKVVTPSGEKRYRIVRVA